MLLCIESLNGKDIPFSGFKHKGASKWLADLSFLFKKTGDLYNDQKLKPQLIPFWNLSQKISTYLYNKRRQSKYLNGTREVQLSSVTQSCRLFATPWTVARQTFLSITVSQSLPKLMSIELVIPFNHLILCHPFLLPPSTFPSIRSFPMSQLFTSGGQSIGVSASTWVLPMNIQDWFPLDGLVGSPCSPRDSQESSRTPQFKSINFSELSFLYSPTLTSVHDHWKNHSLTYCCCC